VARVEFDLAKDVPPLMETNEPQITEVPSTTPPRARPRRRRRPGFGTGCVTGGALTLIALIVMAVLVRRAPDSYSGLARAFFGANRPASGETGTPTLSLEQLQALRGIRPGIQVILSEDDINAYLKEHPSELGLPQGFSAPQVQFRSEQMMLSIRTKVLLWPVRVDVWLRPEVVAGELSLEVVKVNAGRVSLPGEFRQQIQTQMAKVLSSQLETAGVRPMAVEVGEGRLTITAELQPDGG